MNWKLVNETLEQIRNLTTDSQVLQDRYGLVLIDDEPPDYDKSQVSRSEETESTNRFKRLFGSNDRYVSNAAAKVIRAKNSKTKKLRWAAVDKKNLEKLIDDVGRFVGQLHSMLDSTIQMEMSKNIELLLREATNRYSNIPDLEYLKEVVAEMKQEKLSGTIDLDADKLDEEIQRKFANLLHWAIGKDNLQDAQELLDNKGVSANVGDRVGWSPLINAAQRGHIPMMRLLLERGADPLKGTIGDRLPIHFAAENGHVDAVQLLLEQPKANPNFRDKEGQTALFKAANKGRIEVVKILLEQASIEPNTSTIDEFTPLHQTIVEDHIDIVRLLLLRDDVNPNLTDKLYHQTALGMCIPYKDGDMVHIFLDRHSRRKDIDLDAPSMYGETALGRCARQGYIAAAKLLIGAGADINKPNEKGQTPLSAAAAEGREEIMEILLNCPGIDIQSVDKTDNHTALHRACEADRTKCVKLLLAHTKPAPRTDITDMDGNTALHLAAAKGNKIPAKMLLRHQQQRKQQIQSTGEGHEDRGVDAQKEDIINMKNKTGNTALALAATEGNSDRNEAVVRLLLEHGADPALEDEDLETAFEKARDRHLEGIVSVFREVLKM